MSVIYSLVAKDKLIVADYTSFQGNFQAVAEDVVKQADPLKKFSKFATTNYTFYVLASDNLIFLVMVK